MLLPWYLGLYLLVCWLAGPRWRIDLVEWIDEGAGRGPNYRRVTFLEVQKWLGERGYQSESTDVHIEPTRS